MYSYNSGSTTTIITLAPCCYLSIKLVNFSFLGCFFSFLFCLNKATTFLRVSYKEIGYKPTKSIYQYNNFCRIVILGIYSYKPYYPKRIDTSHKRHTRLRFNHIFHHNEMHECQYKIKFQFVYHLFNI